MELDQEYIEDDLTEIDDFVVVDSDQLPNVVLTIEDLLDDGDEPVAESPMAVSVFPAKRVNFLSNKDILREIHKSKCAYCEFTSPHHADYDVIVEHMDQVMDTITQDVARTNRANRLTVLAHEAASAQSTTKLRVADFRINPDAIPLDDLVFRVLTYEHIPLAPGRKKNPKTKADAHVRLNFVPFKHYQIMDGAAVEVGRSHSKSGEFSMSHGDMTRKLAQMIMLMVSKYSQKGNWRGYSYIDEMRGQALLQLTGMVLKFDEYKSENPFSYMTSILNTSFLRVFNQEKRSQALRDDLLINSGASPSFSRQLAEEDAVRAMREEAMEISKHD